MTILRDKLGSLDQTQSLEIVEGPSKMTLASALFADRDVDIQPKFKVVVGQRTEHLGPPMMEFTLRVGSVLREDGSGESWCIKGTVSDAVGWMLVSIYWHSGRKHGHIMLADK